ncbi:MAG: hypothetical protein NVS3B2_12750 [Ramlibacter sp.]
MLRFNTAVWLTKPGSSGSEQDGVSRAPWQACSESAQAVLTSPLLPSRRPVRYHTVAASLSPDVSARMPLKFSSEVRLRVVSMKV